MERQSLRKKRAMQKAMHMQNGVGRAVKKRKEKCKTTPGLERKKLEKRDEQPESNGPQLDTEKV